LIFNLSSVKIYHILAHEMYLKEFWELVLYSDKKIRSIAHIEMNKCKEKEVTWKIHILKVNGSQISVRTGWLLVSKVVQWLQKTQKNFFRHNIKKTKTWRPSKSFRVIPKKFWWSYDKNCDLLIFFRYYRCSLKKICREHL